MVKKHMQPLDDSISIDRPIFPDNKLFDYGQSLALGLKGISAHCLCLDDCVPDDSASGILVEIQWKYNGHPYFDNK